jgi:hypothetical protein
MKTDRKVCRTVSVKSHGVLGPLKQAFILFFHVSGYTAGFGRFQMSAPRLEHVYFHPNTCSRSDIDRINV